MFHRAAFAAQLIFPGQSALAEKAGAPAPSGPLNCTLGSLHAAFLVRWWSNLETDPAAGADARGRTASQQKTTGEFLNSPLLCLGQGVRLGAWGAALTSRTFCLRCLASVLQ